MSDDQIVSYGWCLPSEPPFPLGWVEVWIPSYPDDCGQPHVWETHTSTPACDCAYCTYHYRWLECETTEWQVTWTAVAE